MSGRSITEDSSRELLVGTGSTRTGSTRCSIEGVLDISIDIAGAPVDAPNLACGSSIYLTSCTL